MEFVDLKAQYTALREEISIRMQRVLDHGQYIMGPEVAELEQKLAAYTNSNHCITVSSGTEALLISLMALGIGRGDEVITTPFTFIATAEVIALLGATPVFVDIERDTANIDASKIEAAITPRTRAIMPVSLYGQPADMDEINAIGSRHGLPVIEDAAQSFGATYKGRKSCNLSTIGCTSFFPSKPLGCYGDGGAIFTNDADLAKVMREIRIHGQERRYYHTRIGVGGRMDALQCAVVLAKLDRFDWEVEKRIEAGRRYDELLENVAPLLARVKVRSDRTSVYALYTVLTPRRDALAKSLKEKGIPTAIHYPLALNQQPVFKNLRGIADNFLVAERLASEVLSLPIHAYLSPVSQSDVVDVIGQYKRDSMGDGLHV